MTYTYKLNDTKIALGPIPTGSQESAKVRQLEYNAVGQLTSVCEVTSLPGSGLCGQNATASGYLTKYAYQGGLLSSVQQNAQAGSTATQSRSMAYDLLGRKTSETIPETGTSSFTYDKITSGTCAGTYPGDLIQVVDNAGNVTCMTYDAIHRLTAAIHAGSNKTPNRYFVYDYYWDGGPVMSNTLGTLVEAYTCYTVGCSSTPVDYLQNAVTDAIQNTFYETLGGKKTGRMISQLTESTPKSGGYFVTQSVTNANGTQAALGTSLNAGAIGFPTITYGLDSQGRLNSATDVTDSTNPLSLVAITSYDARTGAVTGTTLGNGDSDGFSYDPTTGRPSGFSYSVLAAPNAAAFSMNGSLTWNSNGSLNNFTFTDNSDNTKSQNCNYTMDDLNRLASVLCAGSWGQSFNYDAFGNIQKLALGTGSTMTSTYMSVTPSLGYSAPTNQVNTAMGGASAAYDANGNQTLSEGNIYSWDAWGQPAVVNGVNATYDALGRLVETDISGVQSHPLTGSTGSIAVSGSEQTLGTPKSFSAFATVTISGFEKSVANNPVPSSSYFCAPISSVCYDQGGGSLLVTTTLSTGSMIDSAAYGFTYGQGDTPDTIASRIAQEINADSTADFTAQAVPGGVINLIFSSTNVSQVTYNLSGYSGCDSAIARPCSFALSAPSTITPVGAGTNLAAIQDSGTVSVVINGGAPIAYAWAETDTPMTIANGLAAAINVADGTIVTATAAATLTGAVVNLASTGTGSSTNYPVTASYTFNNCSFSQPSFTASASGMTGGENPVTGTSATATQYVYTASGSKIAVVQNGQVIKATIPLPGGETAIYNNSGFEYFRHTDWLGSSLLATNWNHSIYSKEAYAPFGETYNEAGTPDRSFTGQDQDTTNSVYDYLFRKFDPVAGRWLSPDPSGWQAASLAYPQSLNRYAYVLNNPTSLTDPNGLDCVYFNDDNSVNHILTGDCDSDYDSGYYVDGTINTQSLSYNLYSGNVGYSYTPYDSDPNTPTIGVGVFDGVFAPASSGQDASVNPTDQGSSIYIDPNPFYVFVPGIGMLGPNQANAPSNGKPKPTLFSCTGTKDVALALGATALDGFGAFPVANEVTGSIQLGAGIVSAGITVYAGNVKNAGFAGTGLGLAAADKSLGEAAFGGAKLIPGLGNLVSGLSAVYDVFGEGGVIDSYKKCLAGKE